MNRAYALLEIREAGKAANGKRTFKGVATTISTDSYGDVIESAGAEFDLPIPLLWQHDSRDPIGWVVKARKSKASIEVECEVADVADGPLKERLDKAWAYIDSKLVRGLSIGFNPIESARIEGTYGYHFTKWKWLELSCVTIAANQDASITAIRSADAELRALSGLEQRGSPPTKGRTSPVGEPKQPASGGFSLSRTQGNDVKTLQQLLEERQTKTARMGELIELRTKGGESFGANESAEMRAIDADLAALEDDIVVARFHERQVAGAQRVDTGAASGQRSAAVISKKDPEDRFPGQSFVRMVKLRALSRLTHESVPSLAEYRFGKSHPQFVQVVRAAVAGHGGSSGEPGAELVALNATYMGDFIEFLYGKVLFYRLPLREVPANVRIKGQDAAATANWVGESKAIPVSATSMSTVDLTPLKVAALTVCSNELIEDSSPAADMLLRDSLVQAIAQKIDGTFFSSAAASAGVSPAGILNGLTPLAPSGTDEAAVRADMQALVYPFVTAKMASGIHVVMNPAQGLALGSFVNTFSQPAFPGINENGGTFMGRPAHTGDNVTPGDIIALRPEDIWRIGDSGIQVSMSDVATIEMNDAPAGASDTPTAMASHAVSMFQTESTAFKVVQRINFAKRRSNAVTVLSNAEYGGVTS